MSQSALRLFPESERAVYSLIAASDGLKAREIAARLSMDRSAVNRLLVSSPLMREMCYQSSDYRWHALIRSRAPHEGLYEFSAWYGFVREFLSLSEEAWLSSLEEGCRRIGRNLNDTRGLIHSFLDCRRTMLALFEDLDRMMDASFRSWEIAFEFRFNRARYVRIYADVLVLTPSRVFSLEFKMKSDVDPEEVLQAAKYAPYLEILFGASLDIVPALVLTRASDFFDYVPIGSTDALLPISSGDMLFNVFNEYLGFLQN